jgi:hypothetical protein
VETAGQAAEPPAPAAAASGAGVVVAWGKAETTARRETKAMTDFILIVGRKKKGLFERNGKDLVPKKDVFGWLFKRVS